VASLDSMGKDELRQLWAELFRIEPLPRISREPLIRGIAYRLQEDAGEGLSRKTARQLECLEKELQTRGRITLAGEQAIRPGTRLVREWRGKVHEIIVLEDEYLWKGSRYRSLSEIAREITGTRWSGPRFFGTGQHA
jgi:hypothetical protein